METTISVRLRKDVLIDIEKIERKLHTDRSEVIRRLLARAIKEWKIQNVLEELSMHKISIGKAAEECGISIWDMLDRIKGKNLDWIDYSEEDIKRDLGILE